MTAVATLPAPKARPAVARKASAPALDLLVDIGALLAVIGRDDDARDALERGLRKGASSAASVTPENVEQAAEALETLAQVSDVVRGLQNGTTPRFSRFTLTHGGHPARLSFKPVEQSAFVITLPRLAELINEPNGHYFESSDLTRLAPAISIKLHSRVPLMEQNNRDLRAAANPKKGPKK